MVYRSRKIPVFINTDSAQKGFSYVISLYSRGKKTLQTEQETFSIEAKMKHGFIWLCISYLSCSVTFFLFQVSCTLPLQHFKLSSALLPGALPDVHRLIWPFNKKSWLPVCFCSWPPCKLYKILHLLGAGMLSQWLLSCTGFLWKCSIYQMCFSNMSSKSSLAFQNLKGRKGREQMDKNAYSYSDT